MTFTFHPTEITISSYLSQTNTPGMGRLITSHNATQEETGTGSKKKEGGLVPFVLIFFSVMEKDFENYNSLKGYN